MFVWRRLEFAFLCAGFGRRTFYFIKFQEDVMKKIICAFLILILCISFCACDGNKDIELETVTTAATTTESSESTTETTSEMKKDYVLNTNSMKFHYPSCHAAEKLNKGKIFPPSEKFGVGFFCKNSCKIYIFML